MTSTSPLRAPAAPTPPTDGARSGAVHHRTGWRARLNAWRKASAFNPYWLTRRSLFRAVAALAARSSGVLLDVGVGERPYGALFAPYVSRYVGLDYPPVLSDKEPAFWSILDRVRRSVDVFGDGAHLPFADRSFDTVLATEVLEHVPDPARLLDEMARVVRPGGRILLTVPFQEALHFLPQDFARFTPSGLRHLLAGAQLEVESIEARGNTTEAIGASLAQWLLRNVAAAEVQSDGSVRPSPWRLLLCSPVIALVQGTAALLAQVANDESQPMGYQVVARKPALSPEPGSSAR